MDNKEHECKIIAPTLEHLLNSKVQTDVLCTQPNCMQIFSNISAMHMHMEKTHNLRTSSANPETHDPYLITNPVTKTQRLLLNCKCKYYCPIENCKYNIAIMNGKSRFMTSYHSLKVHFNRIHGEKTFECNLCKKKFAIKSEMKRHEHKCGQVYKCTCNCPFTTIDSLKRHLQQTKHQIPTDVMGPVRSNCDTTNNQNKIYVPRLTTTRTPSNIIIFNNILIKDMLPSKCTVTSHTSSSELKQQQQQQRHEQLIDINEDFNYLDASTSPLNINLLEDVDTEVFTNISTQTHGSDLCLQANSYTDQRSFGCQTNDNQTIETASQTFQQYLSQQQQQHQHTLIDINYDINYFDASTSPLNIDLLEDALFCNDISTQTCSSSLEQQHFSQSLQRSSNVELQTAHIAHTQTQFMNNFNNTIQTNDLNLFGSI